ncbi:hypothetical protein IP88_15980 [alpha proteobacterium AAP81b]|nr:hypothetical protein IP88_15980 [alpha proteobacterium AAP81b]
MPVECHEVAPGSVACRAGGRDLACAMVASGAATPLGSMRNCPPPPPRAPLVDRDNIPPAWAILSFLGAVNIVAVLAVAFDNYRRRRGFGAIADRLLVMLALIGAGGGVLAAQFALAGRDEERQLSGMVAVILGLQIGAAIGLVLL